MPPLNISDILGKINELRAVFVLGQRAVPFLEEVFYFLKEITPLMDEINSSISESTRSMPHAASQLQSVTQQNELATTEILDLVDTVLARVSQTRTFVDQSLVHLEAMGRSDTRMIRMIRTELAGKNDALLTQLEMMHDEKKALRRTMTTSARTQVDVLEEIRDRMNRIMMSLQVQDITAQQIAAVNHMIESVRDRLARLMERLAVGALELSMEPVGLASSSTFDANARYDHSADRQQLANNVVETYKNGGDVEEIVDTHEQVSIDDIDALFSGGAATSRPASQSDIDALFSSDGPAASSDDIDRLFAGV